MTHADLMAAGCNEGETEMNRVKFGKPMTAAQLMAWSVRMREKNVPPGIPVPVRVQRDGTNIVVHPHQKNKE